MVLCPDVCEANWAKTAELVVLGDNAAKQATVLYQKVADSSDSRDGRECKSKNRLLIEMEDRLLCLLCAFLISYCLPARRGVWVEGKVLWILYNSLLFFPGHHDGVRR